MKRKSPLRPRYLALNTSFMTKVARTTIGRPRELPYSKRNCTTGGPPDVPCQDVFKRSGEVGPRSTRRTDSSLTPQVHAFPHRTKASHVPPSHRILCWYSLFDSHSSPDSLVFRLVPRKPMRRRSEVTDCYERGDVYANRNSWSTFTTSFEI